MKHRAIRQVGDDYVIDVAGGLARLPVREVVKFSDALEMLKRPGQHYYAITADTVVVSREAVEKLNGHGEDFSGILDSLRKLDGRSQLPRNERHYSPRNRRPYVQGPLPDSEVREIILNEIRKDTNRADIYTDPRFKYEPMPRIRTILGHITKGTYRARGLL